MTEISINPTNKLITVTVNGEILAQSDKAVSLKKGSYPPVWYFPKSDINMDGLVASEKKQRLPS